MAFYLNSLIVVCFNNYRLHSVGYKNQQTLNLLLLRIIFK